MARGAAWAMVAVLVSAAGLGAPARATVFRSGTVVRVAPGEVVADDLVAAGRSVVVEGTVQGDVIAAADTVRVPGRIQGNLTALAQSIDIPGGVAGSVRAAAQSVSLSGRVGRNVMFAAQSAQVQRGASVGHDVDAAAQSAVVDGSVAGRAAVAANTALLSGRVAGNLRFEGQTLSLEPGARVGGNLIVRSPNEVSVPDGAVVAGRVERLPARPQARPASPLLRLARALLFALALFVTGAVGIALAPRFLRNAADALTRQPGWSALWGFILLIVTPIAAIIAMVTLVGIPLGLIALALWGFTILLSAIPVGLWLGRWLLLAARPQAEGVSPYGALALGLVLLALAGWIPILGGLVRVAVVLFGIGTFALAAYRLASRPPTAPAAPFAPAA